MNHPITPAIRFLRDKKVAFEPLIFEYLEKGGTKHSSAVLGIEEHFIVKTLIFETSEKQALIVLMHGDLQVSVKELARILKVKSINAVSPEKANKLTGYLVGGTSPFGIKTPLPIYVEETIFNLEKIYINGGKRGFLVAVNPQILQEILKLTKVKIGIKN